MLTAGRGAPSLWIVKRKFVTFHKNGGRRCNVFFFAASFYRSIPIFSSSFTWSVGAATRIRRRCDTITLASFGDFLINQRFMLSPTRQCG